MHGSDEVLEAGRSRLPRWARVLALVAVAAAVAVLVLVRVLPDSSSGPRRATSSPSPSVPPTTAPVAAAAWPTARGACGDTPEQAIVRRTQPAGPTGPTGINLLVGASSIAKVNFDAASATRVPHSGLGLTEYVWSITDSYALAATCSPSHQRLFRIGGGFSRRVPIYSYLLADGGQTWLALPPDDISKHGYLISLPSNRRITLPDGSAPVAVTDGYVVVARSSASSDLAQLGLVDARTGASRGTLGRGNFLAAANGVVLWTDGCDIDSNRSCTVFRRDVTGDVVTNYVLPRPPGFAAAQLSPDGRRLALTLERAQQDPRFDQGHPIPPVDVVVLDLDGTAELHVVPGVELPAKTAPALRFTNDNWLIIGLDAGSRMRLLAWREGLSAPIESRPIAGLVATTPALAVR